MLQLICVPRGGDDYAGRSIQVNGEWHPEGLLSHVHFPKLYLMGVEISWSGSEWEWAKEQGAYYLPWTPSLSLSYWIMPRRRRERFIRSRHPLESNRGLIPVLVQAWNDLLCALTRGSRQKGKGMGGVFLSQSTYDVVIILCRLRWIKNWYRRN